MGESPWRWRFREQLRLGRQKTGHDERGGEANKDPNEDLALWVVRWRFTHKGIMGCKATLAGRVGALAPMHRETCDGSASRHPQMATSLCAVAPPTACK